MAAEIGRFLATIYDDEMTAAQAVAQIWSREIG